jgi:hypothetical protein
VKLLGGCWQFHENTPQAAPSPLLCSRVCDRQAKKALAHSTIITDTLEYNNWVNKNEVMHSKLPIKKNSSLKENPPKSFKENAE